MPGGPSGERAYDGMLATEMDFTTVLAALAFISIAWGAFAAIGVAYVQDNRAIKRYKSEVRAKNLDKHFQIIEEYLRAIQAVGAEVLVSQSTDMAAVYEMQSASTRLLVPCASALRAVGFSREAVGELATLEKQLESLIKSLEDGQELEPPSATFAIAVGDYWKRLDSHKERLYS